MPPESSPGSRSANSASPTSSRYSCAMRARSALASPPLASRANSTLARAVRQGSSVYCWKTTLRSSPGPVIGRPSMRSVPEDGVVNPLIRSRMVDLPHPEGPTSVRNSPAETVRSTSSSATNSRFCLFVSSWTQNTCPTPDRSIRALMASPLGQVVVLVGVDVAGLDLGRVHVAARRQPVEPQGDVLVGDRRGRRRCDAGGARPVLVDGLDVGGVAVVLQPGVVDL